VRLLDRIFCGAPDTGTEFRIKAKRLITVFLRKWEGQGQ
jgi:hypothetical protein